jgi:hypothetical protein
MINVCGTAGERELSGETKVLGENLPQCHIVHHKFHMACSGTAEMYLCSIARTRGQMGKNSVTKVYNKILCLPDKNSYRNSAYDTRGL